MRKTDFFIAFAAACALGMNAQTSESLIPGVKFSVEGQKEVENPYWDGSDQDEQFLPDTYSIAMNSEINMEFVGNKVNDLTQTLGFTPYVMLTTGGGFVIDGTFYSLESSQDGNNPSLYAFPLNKEKWGNPYMGAYNVTPMVCFLKSTGEKLPNEFTQQELAEDDELAMRIEFYMVDDEPVFFQAPSYTTPNTFSAYLIGTYPDNKWEDETFTKAYQNGEAFFSFSNSVTFNDKTYAGEILYVFNDETDNKEVELSFEAGNIVADWSSLDGYYQVSVYYDLPGVSADKIASIEITLFDMTSLSQDIDDETLILNNISARAKKAAQTGKSEMSQELISGVEPVEIFNLQGVKVATMTGKSLPNLPQGIYIANGKKIAIK